MRSIPFASSSPQGAKTRNGFVIKENTKPKETVGLKFSLYNAFGGSLGDRGRQLESLNPFDIRTGAKRERATPADYDTRNKRGEVRTRSLEFRLARSIGR